jgi:hypothetical protein
VRTNGSRLVIERLQVDGGFLDGLDLGFGPGLNVLIGGRGTGKTSVIELLRYCTDAPALAERFGGRAREHALSILRGGKATLTVRADGELTEIVRSGREEPVSLLWRRPIVLSQGEVEVVGTDDRGRLRLIEDFRTVDEVTNREAHAAMSSVKSLTRELAELDAEVELLAQRVAGLQAAEQARREAEAGAVEGELSAVRASGLLEHLEAVAARLAEEAARTGALERSGESLAKWRDLIERAARSAPRLEDWPGGSQPALDELRQVRSWSAKILGDLNSSVERLFAAEQRVRDLLDAQRARVAELDDESRRVRRQADDLQAGAGAAARRLTELREREAELRQLRKVLDERRNRRASARAARDDALEQLEVLRAQRFEERQRIVETLNRELNPRVRIALRRGALHLEYASAIAEALKGSGLHYATLAPLLAARLAPPELARAVEDFDSRTVAQLGEISLERAERVLAQLRSQGVGDVLTAPIEDAVVLELLDGSDYKETSELSTGQRCTVVLPVVLHHQERPVVLDQPEDHLDTAFIVDTLVRSILRRPTGSQLIVSTHNANIPVLGEADVVAVLDSDGRRGFVRHAGPLTAPATVSSIERIMEGGSEAFARRAQFYSEQSH